MSTVDGIADDLLAAEFDAYPLVATVLGVRDREDRLTDYTEAGEEAFRARVADVVARATAVDPAGLTDRDRVTRAVVLHQADAHLDRLATHRVEYTVTDYDAGTVPELFLLLSMVGLTEPAHADGYLARLAGLPRVFADLADRHRAGIAAGRPPVRRLAAAAVAHLDRYLADPDNDPLRRPSSSDPAFRAARDRLLADVVRPAVARYRDALATDVVPRGRAVDRAGLCWLPGGLGLYQRLVRVHTTTDRSPDELHRTGLELADRLAEEYADLGARVFGTTDAGAVVARLRSDPALRWVSGDEVLAAARTTIARAEEVAPRWFGRLPAQRCAVEPVPEADAPGAAGGSYLSPALDGSRPGIYFANTYQAQERHRYVAEAVAFHEGVPGHHFQIALSQELTDLPLLRRLGGITAYEEGWALYAERLADEMGLYSGDLARLGMVGQDSVRAARLVVDTGLHAKGWSRQQAVDYMVANTAMPPLEVDTEVDRYIADPGQALAYMVGRLEIQRIRTGAERVLGERFDIRAFHDAVLSHGPLPMAVLDEAVRSWAGGRNVG